jgi:hypothetical protein
MENIDFDDDTRDGILFRFWIHGASNFPNRMMKALMHCTTPAEYRAALTLVANEKGINLP